MRIAVIYPSPFLDSTPCLFNLIQGLADLGHELDVFTGRDGRYTDPDFSGSVRVWFHEGSRREFIGWFSRQTRGKIGGYAAIIAMDRLGMFAAAAAIRLSKRPPLVYFNLELYRPPIFRGWKHAIANSAEAFLIRRMARLILAPSKERGEALANWYRLRSGDIFTLPNAPRGMAAAAKGDYLAKKYGILPERPTALYFGSLTSANRIEELIQSARQNWPEEFVLVLHGRQRGDEDSRRWFAEQAAGARCRIIFSLVPLPPAELRELVRSADAGIALYPTAGDGFATMGTASGKIAQYLHCGVPVVTTRLPSLVSALERYAGAGKIVESADEIPSAVKNFLANPAENRRAAARCFDAEFSFDRAFEKFVARFEACVNTPN